VKQLGRAMTRHLCPRFFEETRSFYLSLDATRGLPQGYASKARGRESYLKSHQLGWLPILITRQTTWFGTK